MWYEDFHPVKEAAARHSMTDPLSTTALVRRKSQETRLCRRQVQDLPTRH